MPKPAAKRKASDANLDAEAASGNNQLLATLDLSNAKTKPKTISTALLSLLPDGATSTHPSSKLLAKAFALVKTELESRSNAMARSNEDQGTRQPITFYFPSGDGGINDNNDGPMIAIDMPEECFVNVMKFLPGKAVVQSSICCKSWLSVSRMSSLWERLDELAGLTNSGSKMNMTYFLKLLARPQFANLKHLAIPRKIKVGKSSMKKIAELCPFLEVFDIGYSCRYTDPKAKDDDLIEAVERIPNLKSIRFDMWNITNYGISSVARAMEGQLLDLRIEGDTITKHYLSDAALEAVAQNCPNLKVFAYGLSSYYYEPSLDLLTGDGVISLVESCRCLELLQLTGAMRVERSHFQAIMKKVNLGRSVVDGRNAASAGGTAGFALRKIEVSGYPFTIADYPFQFTETASENNL